MPSASATAPASNMVLCFMEPPPTRLFLSAGSAFQGQRRSTFWRTSKRQLPRRVTFALSLEVVEAGNAAWPGLPFNASRRDELHCRPRHRSEPDHAPEAAVSTVLPQTIYVARVGGVRQGGDIGGHVRMGDPAAEGEGLALAERQVETAGAKRNQAVQTAQGHFAPDGGELEGERRQEAGKAGQHGVLE